MFILRLITLWLFVASVAQASDYEFFTQGGIVFGKAGAGEQVTLDGEAVQVSPAGYYVIGFSRDRVAPAVLQFLAPDGKVLRTQTHEIAKREFNIERIEGLPPKTVTPPPEWLERRKGERARVGKARAPVTDALDWRAGFIKPAEGRYSGFYGSQRILNGQPRSPHFGIDIANKTGTPVVAPAGGIVRLAAPDFLLEGGIIIIDHGHGVNSTLFHLDTVTVEEGVRVEQGALIGTIGATGRATGPHVDWRINWGKVKLDPGLVIGVK